MREIVIDTETTGLDPLDGHRIVEIGAVELINRSPTGRKFHHYLCPERAMPADAVAVHGLTAEFLADKPLFAEVTDEFLAFVGDVRRDRTGPAEDSLSFGGPLGWEPRRH